MLLKRGSESRQLIRRSLRSGSVIVIACDTIYGFVGRAPDTAQIIRAIKGSDRKSLFLQLISDASSLNREDIIVPKTGIFSLWPGPYTFVFRKKSGETAAFRVPKDSSIRRLIGELGFPLYSSSVNRSGRPPMNNPEDIDIEFGQEIALIEDSGKLVEKQPSTVVDLTLTPFKVLRQGAGIVPLQFL